LEKKNLFWAQFAGDILEDELQHPNARTFVKIVWQSIRSFFVEKPGQIIISAFILIMVWGTHGRMELLALAWPDWLGPGSVPAGRPVLIAGIPWDHELISFVGGFILLVVIPVLLIRFVFKQPLSYYGLGLPPKGRWTLAGLTFLILTLISLPAFWLGAGIPAMQATYPLYRSFSGDVGQFVVYQLVYLLFFIVIEFVFRGYLLFGLANIMDREVGGDNIGYAGPYYFHKYALLIQMLSYTAWHLGKPLPELWGTLIWGLAAGAVAYSVRSIWPVILSHWLLNVFMDSLIVFGS
jgi:membrane protease YdiL (CAAX protease family)